MYSEQILVKLRNDLKACQVAKKTRENELKQTQERIDGLNHWQRLEDELIALYERLLREDQEERDIPSEPAMPEMVTQPPATPMEGEPWKVK